MVKWCYCRQKTKFSNKCSLTLGLSLYLDTKFYSCGNICSLSLVSKEVFPAILSYRRSWPQDKNIIQFKQTTPEQKNKTQTTYTSELTTSKQVVKPICKRQLKPFKCGM